MFYIVLLAMVGAFLAMRLYMVLGKRTGHEQQPVAPSRVPSVPVAQTIDGGELRDITPRTADARAEAGLRQIAAAGGFDTGEFVDGAKNAYRMILEAYWKGDRETLDWLAERDVAAAFGEEIARRAEAGHILDNRLVTIERATIEQAEVVGGTARITVKFDADIASVTRDADGNIVSGSMTDATETHELWTFARAMRSDDPNWKLADTDEA